MGAMELPRVGVLTDDPTMVVALGLRCPSLAFVPVRRPDEMSGHDLLLVDLPRPGLGNDEVVALAQTTPVVALVSERAEAPTGVPLVRRPCSVDHLVAALVAALDGQVQDPVESDQTVDETHVIALDDDVIVIDEVPTLGPPLFDGHRGSHEVAGGPVALAAPPDGRARRVAARLARQLREIHVLAEPLGASTVVTAAIAAQLAEELGEACGADHLALWARYGSEHLVVAATGDRAVFAGIDLRQDAPLLVEARREPSGIVVRGPGERDLSGVPGVGRSVLGVVVLGEAGPVHVVTALGPRMTPDALRRIGDVLVAEGGPSSRSPDRTRPPRPTPPT